VPTSTRTYRVLAVGVSLTATGLLSARHGVTAVGGLLLALGAVALVVFATRGRGSRDDSS